MILAHKTRIRTANPGSAIANALAQHDGAARWAYNNLLASLKDGSRLDHNILSNVEIC